MTGMSEDAYPWSEHRYGVRWGPVSLHRYWSDSKYGVWLALVTPREAVEIRVTKSGLLRIGKVRKLHDHERTEWDE